MRNRYVLPGSIRARRTYAVVLCCVCTIVHLSFRHVLYTQTLTRVHSTNKFESAMPIMFYTMNTISSGIPYGLDILFSTWCLIRSRRVCMAFLSASVLSSLIVIVLSFKRFSFQQHEISFSQKLGDTESPRKRNRDETERNLRQHRHA